MRFLCLALVACSAKPSPPIANVAHASEPPQATAIRGFVEALAAGDVPLAQSYLPGDAACAQGRPALADLCKQTATSERAMIPAIQSNACRTYPSLGVPTMRDRAADATTETG